MKYVQLLLTRHGETLENQRHILQGQLPGTLSPLGLQQAADLADKLAEESLDAIVCSDLARSFDTANAVALRHDLTPEPTPLLREMDWGIYTGDTLEEVDWYHLPASVESVEDLYERAGQFLDYLLANYTGKRILAVGHGAFNRAILAYVQSGAPFDMVNMRIMDNTEVVELMITETL